MGPAGPAGPPGLEDGIIDGSPLINGNLGVTGNLSVTGSLSAGGRLLTYPSQPMLLSGIVPNGCGSLTWSSGNSTMVANTSTGMAVFPVRFPSPPVAIATVDESTDASGGTWVRLPRVASNRAAFNCNSSTDAIHWLAIEPGVHTIDGRPVEAGISTPPTANGGVSFQAPFTEAPVVLLSSANATVVRVTLNTTELSFTFTTDNGSPVVHWIAMPEGTYKHGRFRWTAGFASGACTTGCSFNISPQLETAPQVLLTTNHFQATGGANWARLTGFSPSQINFQMNAQTNQVNYLVLEDRPEDP